MDIGDRITKRIDQNPNIEASIVINKFLTFGNFKKKTKWTYKSHLKTYFEYLKVKPDDYFQDVRDYEKDVILFVQKIQSKSPNYRRSVSRVIRMFLEENDIELPNKFWRKIKRTNGKKRAITDSKIPTPQELKEILQHGELKARALFLVLSSSGMRIGEATQIRIKDIDLCQNPPRIFIPAKITKTESSRVCFITSEARDVLYEWLYKKSIYTDDNGNEHEMSPRDYFLKTSLSKCNVPTKKTIDDNRVFPFTDQLSRKIWNRLLRKSNHDEIDSQTKFHKIHLHCLRKYFKTYSELPYSVVEQLMGHEGNLEAEYHRLPESKLAEKYQEEAHNLLVFEREKTIIKVDNTEVQRLQKEMDSMRKVIDQLSKTINTELDDTIKKKQVIDNLPIETQTLTKKSGKTFKVLQTI